MNKIILLKKYMAVCLVSILCIQMTGCGQVSEKERDKEEITILEKTVLYYGVISSEVIDPWIQNAIKEFNKENPDFMIEIKEYGGDSEGDTTDIDTGIVRLNADIINGNGPDILTLPVRFSMNLYAEKGVLEDLYPYIDRDEILDRSDFIPNIIKAYETNDKLYGIPVAFWIETLVGKTSVIGERSSWNLDEMIAFADSCSDEIPIFEDASKSGVMRICQYANWDQLVDWDGKKNLFNRGLYIKMLEFSNRFINDEEYSYDENIYKKIADDQLLLMDSKYRISNPTADTLFSAIFGEPVIYIGYPSETGCGSLANSLNAMAINAGSPYKEAAWEFMRSILSKEYHESNPYLAGYSIRKDGLEKQFEKAKEMVPTVMSMGEYFSMEIETPKEEEIEKLRRLIYSVDGIPAHDYQISDIMAEEAQMYFSGSKTAQEVADIVENRIQVYMNEAK